MNIPNILTLIRIALIPIFLGLFYLPFNWANWACAIVFAVAAVTDWLDGFLARQLNQTTRLGAFLDPVADKLMVAVALVALVEQHHSIVLTIPALVIIGREIAISALREWMSEIGKRTSVAVSFMGKLKTTAQMIAILVLLANPPTLLNFYVWMGYVLLYLAAGLTLWTMLIYVKAAWPELNKN
jgi:CDP-diacylglycerol---glycerol-3-phosphate 3-phosphatidyltransferase